MTRGAISLLSGSTTNWFRFIGRSGYYCDIDLGDYHLRARTYSPGFGRFLSLDPLTASLRFSDYLYVNNMPTSHIDPSGMQGVSTYSCTCPGPVGGAGGVLWCAGCTAGTITLITTICCGTCCIVRLPRPIFGWRCPIRFIPGAINVCMAGCMGRLFGFAKCRCWGLGI